MHRRDSEAEPQQYEFAHERDVIKLDRSEALGRAVAENIYPKLGVADKASSVAKALRFGLID
jgi:hypothetical protein